MFLHAEIERRLRRILRLTGKEQKHVLKALGSFIYHGIFRRDAAEYDHGADKHLQFLTGVRLLRGQLSAFHIGHPPFVTFPHICLIGIDNSLLLLLFMYTDITCSFPQPPKK